MGKSLLLLTVVVLNLAAFWLKLLAIRWFLTAEIGQPAWVSAATIAICSVIVSAVGRIPIRKLEQASNKNAAAFNIAVNSVLTAVIAYGAFNHTLDWMSVTAALAAVSLVSSLTVGHLGRLKGEMGGADQTKLAFLFQAGNYLGRTIAAFAVYGLSLGESWKLFSMDSALSVPLLLVLLAWRSKKEISVTEETPLSLRDGYKIISSSIKLRVLFSLTGLIATAQIVFALIPEILSKEMGLKLPHFALWFALSGICAFLGAMFGKWIRDTRGYTTNQLMGLYTLSMVIYVFVGLSEGFYGLTAMYGLFAFCLVPVDCLVEGAQKESGEEFLGVIERLRNYYQTVIAAVITFLWTLLFHSLGFTARQILLITACVHLIGAIWLWFWIAKWRIKIL